MDAGRSRRSCGRGTSLSSKQTGGPPMLLRVSVRWRAPSPASFALGAATVTGNVAGARTSRYIKHRLNLKKSRTTVNREWQLLGQAMRLAKRKKLLTDVPHIEKFSEKDNARQGFFEQEEFERDVIRLPPEIAKNKDGRVIMLIGEIANIIAHRQAERVESCPYVFHRDGQRIKHYNRAWRTAREKAGLPGRLFHDARRTAVRNMDRAGVPRQTAKQITGHKTDAIYNRYRIVHEQDIHDGLMQAQTYLASNLGQKTDKRTA